MKNIQVIDGASNCIFPLFEATDEQFRAVFPGDGQDIEFIEDVIARMGEEESTRLLESLWERPVLKSKVSGIHGTLFYDFADKREGFPASKREKDYEPSWLNDAQRKAFEAEV